MSDQEATPPPAENQTSAEKQNNGLLRRMFLKLDASMKAKADEKHKQGGGCCGPNDKGDGKCC
ncbi:MAG: hypothetical protein NWT08_09485 [Akkermansiaceae bacterium]|jgi:hypothetical protein|nr:hypothetical protein [Akkermansiaceae bacterium]MDP4647030.1 hypothetical protein [Akkermansiaceae bacterium]MDP4721271.1 hypothetical protein [Akkermansiaceae bacterium]MDP4778961.1 hypothetical protein [Akkermansiaceae bacterium]MDP4847163.1 hypothetical protein [Akkermansiaceae bacterium]